MNDTWSDLDDEMVEMHDRTLEAAGARLDFAAKEARRRLILLAERIAARAKQRRLRRRDPS